MKVVESRSSTGGLIKEYFNQDGQRVRVVHTAGNSYSGKSVKDDDPEVPTGQKKRRSVAK